MKLLARWLALVVCCLATLNCWTPGKFTATIRLNTDRSYDFTYSGAMVIADALRMEQNGVAFGAGQVVAMEECQRRLKLRTFAG